MPDVDRVVVGCARNTCVCVCASAWLICWLAAVAAKPWPCAWTPCWSTVTGKPATFMPSTVVVPLGVATVPVGETAAVTVAVDVTLAMLISPPGPSVTFLTVLLAVERTPDLLTIADSVDASVGPNVPTVVFLLPAISECALDFVGTADAVIVMPGDDGFGYA